MKIKTEDMENANGRENGANDGIDGLLVKSKGDESFVHGAAVAASAVAVRMPSSDSVSNTPLSSPCRS